MQSNIKDKEVNYQYFLFEKIPLINEYLPYNLHYSLFIFWLNIDKISFISVLCYLWCFNPCSSARKDHVSIPAYGCVWVCEWACMCVSVCVCVCRWWVCLYVCECVCSVNMCAWAEWKSYKKIWPVDQRWKVILVPTFYSMGSHRIVFILELKICHVNKIQSGLSQIIL